MWVCSSVLEGRVVEKRDFFCVCASFGEFPRPEWKRRNERDKNGKFFFFTVSRTLLPASNENMVELQVLFASVRH